MYREKGPPMPVLGNRTQRAWAELKENVGMMLEIEKEGLNLARSETERRHDLLMRKLRRRKD